jgi:hypothetical protein
LTSHEYCMSNGAVHSPNTVFLRCYVRCPVKIAQA